jgi:dTDP-4-amino-4,6-dideoxygalactose transaminase
MSDQEPFLPFTRPSIDEATIAAVGAVLRSGWITTGPKSRELEKLLGIRFGGRPTRVVNSATAALEIGLRLAGVQAGDEVITTPLSWVATGNVILQVGARPVFVDVDPISRNIDLGQVEAAVTERTKVLLPVDLAGLPVERDRLYAIARRHGLRVLEDAAQSMGARFQGREIGSFGDLVAISFHANKNMTTGEGGCLVMNNADEAGRFEKLRLQGVSRGEYGEMDVDTLGGKSNLTDIAAAIGLGQLAQIDAFNAKRKVLVRHYFETIDRELGLTLPAEDFEDSNWHMFQPLLPPGCNRPAFVAAMHEHGIGVGVHYPAMHLFSLYRALGYREGMYPNAERIGRSTVTLPLFPAMQTTDVERVCGALRDALSAQG